MSGEIRIGYQFVYRGVPYENFITVSSLHHAVFLFPCLRGFKHLRKRVAHHLDTANLRTVLVQSLLIDAQGRAVEIGLLPPDRAVSSAALLADARRIGLGFWMAPA
jgi:hypothetical protein